MRARFFVRGQCMLLVPVDRYSARLGDAIRGHAGANEGRVEGPLKEPTVKRFLGRDMMRLALGFCLQESLEEAEVRRAIQGQNEARAALDEVDFEHEWTVLHRYTLLDGQRLITVSPQKTDPLLFQVSHASVDHQDWRDWFPADVYA